MRKAYTILELLTVIAIVAVLAALLFPVLVGAKKEAHKTVCASNMHQIYLAVKLYQGDNDCYPEDINGPAMKAYYRTPLYCPSSTNLNRPNLRLADYQFVGTVQPEKEAAFDRCRELKGSSLILVLDQNHIASIITENDNVSRYLLVREDGSFASVPANSVQKQDGSCHSMKLPFWYDQ